MKKWTNKSIIKTVYMLFGLMILVSFYPLYVYLIFNVLK